VVDGCYCELDTLAKVNHDHLKPLLSQLVNQTFFKFFKLNLYQVPPPPPVLASIATLFLILHTTRHDTRHRTRHDTRHDHTHTPFYTHDCIGMSVLGAGDVVRHAGRLQCMRV
jgi:hypothetical protein